MRIDWRKSTPCHLGGKAHQNGVDVAAGLQPEQRAAVVDEVELGVTAAPPGPAGLALRRPFLPHPPPHDPREDVEEGLTDVAAEGEVALERGLVGTLHV